MVAARPGGGLPFAHGRGGLPASWPGLQGVSVWSSYPRCPAGVRAVVWGVPSLPPQSRRRCGVPGSDGGFPRSAVLSFPGKGLEEAFPAEKSRAVVRECIAEEAPYEQAF